MSMTEVRGEDGQPPLNIFPCAMPAQQRLDCKAMTKVVQARTVAGRSAADANLSGNHVKDPTDLPFIKPSTVTGTKEERGFPVCEQAVPPRAVVGEDVEARSVEGDQPGLTEFGSTDRKNALSPVNISGSKV
jgi:hypothetical protein